MMMSYLKDYNPLVKQLFAAMELEPWQQESLLNPKTMVMQDQAILDVASFFKHAERLMICGDYDCDGITSTSIAVRLARKCGLDVGYYIPNRFTEGYGTSKETIQLAYDKGYTDVLMIDNGVKAYEAIELAKSLGMRVAIVDHHIIEETPDVDAFLHPDVLQEYGDTMCAGGLIFCVAEAMGYHDDMMCALAALATIGDVMPLWQKNREIVRRGTAILNQSNILQFDKIVKRNRYTNYSAQFLAFQMVPKINSIGRMADVVNVNTAVSFFTTEDPKAIDSYVKQVLKLNDYRKEEGKRLQAIATSKITNDPVQIIVDKGFHEGLVGIAANHIANITQKPSLILVEYDDHYKGSGRSMTQSLQKLFEPLPSEYFIAMGGHDFAFGMSVKKDKFEDFKLAINAQSLAMPQIENKELIVDVDPRLIDKEAIKQLREFEPYGEGFKLPMVRVALPNTYSLFPLGHYGYKFSFTQFPLDEAVFFKPNLEKNSLVRRQAIIGNLDLNQVQKTSILVHDII